MSCLLNSLKFVVSHSDIGSWCHIIGAAILKDRAAKVLHLVKEIINLVLSLEDLRLLGFGDGKSRSFRYCGAVLMGDGCNFKIDSVFYREPMKLQ